MKDAEIEKDVGLIKSHVTLINELIASLHGKGVEVRISYKDSTSEKPPTIDLWRVTEHVDYLK